MAFAAKILKDSMSPDNVRLTTMEVTFPRIVLAEFNTHRTFSRNSASSRAIPVEKILKKVQEDPFIPVYWGKNQKGMQAERELLPSEQAWAETEWLEARDVAVRHAEQLLAIGVHKQITNRLLEPWLWQTVIVTATEWDNFFALRCHPDAQPEIRHIAMMMQTIYDESTPDPIALSQWHLPLVDDIGQLVLAGFSIDEIKQISAGRCARVSYLTHDGKRDPKADIELCVRLQTSGHMSPLEHVATPVHAGLYSAEVFIGNFRGWTQMRKQLPHESNFKEVLESRR